MRRSQAALGSVLFLVVAPGVVAGLVPWLLIGWQSSNPATAVVVLGSTLRLVVVGVYRHVRNLMYLAVGATIVGQALVLGRRHVRVELRRADAERALRRGVRRVPARRAGLVASPAALDAQTPPTLNSRERPTT